MTCKSEEGARERVGQAERACTLEDSTRKGSAAITTGRKFIYAQSGTKSGRRVGLRRRNRSRQGRSRSRQGRVRSRQRSSSSYKGSSMEKKLP